MLFGISSGEANGVIVLFILLGAMIFSSLILLKFHDSKYTSFESDQRMLDSMLNIIRSDTVSIKVVKTHHYPLQHYHLARFNPNEEGVIEFDSLGIPEWLSERIVNYRKSGGRFEVKSDMKKIYGMPDELYLRLKDYIELPDSIAKEKTAFKVLPVYHKITPENQTIDLNQADSLDLVKINGIGPVLAERILKYRKLLGGFVSPEQLNEIYGLKTPGLNHLKNSVIIKQTFIPAKININFAEWRQLVHHPYITKDMADEIIKHRDASGPFRSINDLKQISSFNDSIIERISPYITF